MQVTFLTKTGVPCEIRHIVETAGMCYDKTDKSTKTNDEILKIAQSLYTKHHHSAFEFIDYEVQIDGLSIVAMKQITRHKNPKMVKSGRYCKENEINFYLPESIIIRNKDVRKNAQFRDALEQIENMYYILLKEGIKPEDARYILPQALTTSMRFKFNLRDWLFSIAPQRISSHAQEEVRDICVAIFNCLSWNVSPLTKIFFEWYIVNNTEIRKYIK